MLLNFENLVVAEFGPEAALGDRLTVPLQLSGFRNDDGLTALKTAQAQLPTDVMDFLSRHREEVPDDVLRSPEYALQIFFIPVTANRERSADAVVRFLKPDQVTPEVQQFIEQNLAVVEKPRRVAVASHDLLLPKEVVSLVTARLPFRFTMDTHTRCWRHFKVRPIKGAGEADATDQALCRFDRLLKSYGYTQAWVDKLVNELSDPEVYKLVVGFSPELR